MAKLYTIEQLQVLSTIELEELAIENKIETSQGVMSLINALLEVEAPVDNIVEVSVNTNVNISTNSGVVFSCGGNHVVNVGLVGKTLAQAMDAMREVMNLPPANKRVVFHNGIVTTVMSSVLAAGDIVDVTVPAGSKGIQ